MTNRNRTVDDTIVCAPFITASNFSLRDRFARGAVSSANLLQLDSRLATALRYKLQKQKKHAMCNSV